MSRKNIFEKEFCDRCGSKLGARIMSWFTTEIICMDCSEKENKIKEKLDNPNEYEGCGYVPKVGDTDEL